MKNCKICKKEFIPQRTNLKNRSCEFCSLPCYWVSLKGRKHTEEHKNKIGKSLIGHKGSKWMLGRKHSSETLKKLSDKAKNRLILSGDKSPNWKGGDVQVSCFECCNLIHKKKSNVRTYNFCSKDCFTKSSFRPKGKEAYAWKGGKKVLTEEEITRKENAKKTKRNWRYIEDRSLLKKTDRRNDSAYKEWRMNVYKRDIFKCKISNEDCNGRIEAHHILGWTPYPELRYDINNGITLCHHHHPRKRIDEKEKVNLFKQLITLE